MDVCAGGGHGAERQPGGIAVTPSGAPAQRVFRGGERNGQRICATALNRDGDRSAGRGLWSFLGAEVRCHWTDSLAPQLFDLPLNRYSRSEAASSSAYVTPSSLVAKSTSPRAELQILWQHGAFGYGVAVCWGERFFSKIRR